MPPPGGDQQHTCEYVRTTDRLPVRHSVTVWCVLRWSVVSRPLRYPPVSGEPLALPAWVRGGTGRLLCTVSQAHAGPSERTEQVGTTKVRFTLIHHASRKLVKNDESALAFYSMLVWRYVAKGLYVHKPCISDTYAFMETAFLVKTITRLSV